MIIQKLEQKQNMRGCTIRYLECLPLMEIREILVKGVE
jgi:hypothetical protein